MGHLLHLISHALGIDTQQSHEYDFWSGIATQMTLLIGVAGVYRRNNCHVRWCWRIGHIDPDHHHPACRKHHSHAHLL